MAKHIVKCKYCGKSFDASVEPYVKQGNRYAHDLCAKEKEKNKTKEERDKEELERYIKELFDLTALTPKIWMQIKDFKEKKGFSYSGMYKTLKYFFEVKKNSIEKANQGIGIVLYTYDEARQYWRKIWEAQQKNQDAEVRRIVREVHIPLPKKEPIRKLFTFLDEEE